MAVPAKKNSAAGPLSIVSLSQAQLRPWLRSSSSRTSTNRHARRLFTAAISFATVTAAAEAIERGVNKRARELTRHPHTVTGG